MRNTQLLSVALLLLFVAVSSPVIGGVCGTPRSIKQCTSLPTCQAKVPSCGVTQSVERTTLGPGTGLTGRVTCEVTICGEDEQVEISWILFYPGTPNDNDSPTEFECDQVVQNLDRCESEATPECPEPEFSAVEEPGPQFVGSSPMDRFAVGAYVDLPRRQLVNPNRSANIFFGVDGLDRLTLLTAELWGVTEKAAGVYMERLYERLPHTSILQRTDSHYELLLPDGGLLEFDRREATHPMWNGVVVETLVLTSGQSSAEAAQVLGLTPVRIADADRRRSALVRARGK